MEERIYVGTDTGLIFKNKSERSWRPAAGSLGMEAVHLIEAAGTGVLVATKNEVYLIYGDGKQKRIFSLINETEELDLADEAEEARLVEQIKDIDVLGSFIYLTTDKGVYLSKGDLNRFRPLDVDGLPFRLLTSLVVLPQIGEENIVCAGTGKGVFCLDNRRWVPVYAGMSSLTVGKLTDDPEGNIFALTEKTVWMFRDADQRSLAAGTGELANECQFRDYAEIEKMFWREPGILDVQKMAADYADVNKDKIDTWKRQAKLKALIPQVSAGVGRSATDLFHWDTGPNPDVLQKGREYLDWDVSVSWELSDFIWSTDQTSIDSRSKLTVELRVEIIDQVTRIYFERRRLQIELAACQYQSIGERMAVEMRIHELTALIDGYTGGNFSRKVNQCFNQQPRRG